MRNDLIGSAWLVQVTDQRQVTKTIVQSFR